MAELDETRLKEIIEELDMGVPKDGALIHVAKSFKPIGNFITATKLGLLRLGIEAMKAALEPRKIDPLN